MVDWDDEEPLPPIEHLRELSELLDMVQHWRMIAERLQDEKDARLRAWRKSRNSQPDVAK